MNLQRAMDISTSGDSATLERRLIAIAHDLDFEIATATLVLRPNGQQEEFFAFGNTPKAFAQFSRDVELSKRDPLLRMLKARSAPLSYDQRTYLDSDAADLWELQAPHGFKTGLAIALHLANKGRFILGFDRGAALPADPGQLSQLFADLSLIAVFAQDAASGLFARKSDRVAIRLTNQEIECLKWRGDGKSAWETGAILGLSESRINKVCASAMKKLDCSGTSQAALRAVRLGLFD